MGKEDLSLQPINAGSGNYNGASSSSLTTNLNKLSIRNNTEASTYSSEHEHDNFSQEELTLSQIVVRSDFANQSSDEISRIILERFNRGIDVSAFTDSPALGRALPRVDASYYVMGSRNSVAELFDPKGSRFSTVFNPDPTIIIAYDGPILKTQRYFGANSKHVLNVPAGHYAKAVSKNRPVLYGEGPHVIVDPTFQFDEFNGFVNQQEQYINHSTINILRIPAGKVAKVWVGTQPFILESRRDPYVFVDAQFRLVTPDGQSPSSAKQLFNNASDQIIENGSIKRITPFTGQVAITYNNGTLTIIKTPKDGKPVIIDSPTHIFEGFLNTKLETSLFPSKETKQQALLDNRQATSDEVNLKIFQTRDSLRVGVVLVVAFKIIDPELAITKLGKEGIVNHIENVSFADMGKAIQLSTLQEVMYFNQIKPGSTNVEDGSSLGHQNTEQQTIQDRVKSNLAKDLIEYGIELARLQIETMKVLDTEIAKKLAGQSITSAEYTTKQASLVKEYDIKTTEAHMKAETDNIALEQKNKAVILDAQAKLSSAQKEAEALLIAADAQRKAQEMKGELYAKYPALLELEMAKIRAEALKGATIYITPQDVGNFMSSPLLYFNSMNNANNKTINK